MDSDRGTAMDEPQHPLPVDYRPAHPAETWPDLGLVLGTLVTALGGGLLLYALGCVWMEFRTFDVPTYLGWGGGLMILGLPALLTGMLRGLRRR